MRVAAARASERARKAVGIAAMLRQRAKGVPQVEAGVEVTASGETGGIAGRETERGIDVTERDTARGIDGGIGLAALTAERGETLAGTAERGIDETERDTARGIGEEESGIEIEIDVTARDVETEAERGSGSEMEGGVAGVIETLLQMTDRPNEDARREERRSLWGIARKEAERTEMVKMVKMVKVIMPQRGNG